MSLAAKLARSASQRPRPLPLPLTALMCANDEQTPLLRADGAQTAPVAADVEGHAEPAKERAKTFRDIAISVRAFPSR
jgi:hypothetical protein